MPSSLYVTSARRSRVPSSMPAEDGRDVQSRIHAGEHCEAPRRCRGEPADPVEGCLRQGAGENVVDRGHHISGHHLPMPEVAARCGAALSGGRGRPMDRSRPAPDPTLLFERLSPSAVWCWHVMESSPSTSEYPDELRLRVGVEFRHQLERPTPAVLQVEPRRDGPYRILEEELTAPVGIATREYLDIYGNVCRRLVIPTGASTIRYLAEVQVTSRLDPASPDAQQMDVDTLPDAVLIYTMPSRLIESDLLARTAWRLFGSTAPGWSRVQAVVAWVHDNIEYAQDSSTSITSASEVYLSSRGVCRDLAQLSVAFCRALSIPARYVFGYLPDVDIEHPYDLPMDFYAWFEAYLGDRWWTFDPRNNQRRRCRVAVGRGRDAVDVAMITAFGSAPLTGFRVWAETMAKGERLDHVDTPLP